MASDHSRPVAILGGGVLGRRIAACWASAGYNVRVREPNAEQGALCVQYVTDNIHAYPAAEANIGRHGAVSAHEDLETAIRDAWLVIEAIPEKIDLKTATFAQLERVAPSDAILATNSSSYKSSEMLGGLQDDSTKRRILNLHYFMPPDVMVVELMTDGFTDASIISMLAERLKEAGLIPFVARKESTGFIFNRLWAAIKRETLTILADGISTPEEIDSMWKVTISGAAAPCKMMDKIGLDTIAFIEDHYVHERQLSPEKTVDFLQKNYLDHGRLGLKSAKGGLYSRAPRLLVLDVGLAASASASAGPMNSGSILEISADGRSKKVLLSGQRLPDGIDYDAAAGRIFWTCMGVPGRDNGELFSARLEGSDVTDVRSIVAPGIVNTPKQLTVEPASRKLYFCDREGMRVLRCGYDGSGLEVLVQRGDWRAEGVEQGPVVSRKWCVGIAVAPRLGKFYWTQKGPSKSGLGRIFCASIDNTGDVNGSASQRTDIQLVLDGLPEPIDLEIDQGTNTLYWTDRGELPFGNSVNRAQLNPASGLVVAAAKEDGKSKPFCILTRHYNEAIGIKLDVEAGCMYVTDLGGSVYRCSLDGSTKERIFSDDASAFTGITLA